MKYATFGQYLRTQQKRKDSVGDFARDACDDKDAKKPKGRVTAGEWLHYLDISKACNEAVEAFKTAWLEWCGEEVTGDEDDDHDEEGT